MSDDIVCFDCGRIYEPDQYNCWCNECGEKNEREFWKLYFAGNIWIDNKGFWHEKEVRKRM